RWPRRRREPAAFSPIVRLRLVAATNITNGLVLACMVAVLSAFADVSRKKVLDRGQEASLVVLWCKLIALACYLAGTVVLLARGLAPALPPIGISFGVSPPVAFGIFLLLNVVLEGSA